ncbi:glycosyltransferase family 4 protein [Geodermatophilus sp. SYSU D00742]
MTDPASRRVAYLVSRYPSLSHAFIETEIRALRDLGVEVHPFSVRPSTPGDLLSDRAREEAAATTVLLRGSLRTFLRASLALVLRSPGAVPAGLRLAARSGPATPRGRLWQAFYLYEAVVLWWRMSRTGLRHVHVHFANNGADIARLAVALGAAVDGPDGGWRWSLSMHGPTEFEDRTTFDLADKVASASAVACISDFCRSQVMRLLPPSEWGKTGIVRMAVDTTRFRPLETTSARPEDGGDGDLRILTVGRLVPEKGAPVLVEAVARLRAAGIRARLTVVGAGPLAAQLAEQVRADGLTDAVDLVGPVGQQHLPDLYRAADVFCLPSFAEGLPVVLMEAMASGRPVVTTAIAGIPELVVHGRTGLVVPPGRADLIAEALAELAADPALRRRLGEAGRAAVLEAHRPDDNARLLTRLWEGSTDGGRTDGLPARRSTEAFEEAQAR